MVHQPSALVVDDEALSTRAISKALTRAGYTVSAADGVEAALVYFRSGLRFDVVLTDLRMVNGSGEELYEAIQALDAGQARRVAFVSGDLMLAFHAAHRHGVPFLTKPFTNDELLRLCEGLRGEGG